ncbi:MAG: carboxypeptidase-like regulatory protein [Mucilaginibacter sp.]|nr:carboxypeptidase-like regulatory protein [Mucilaginibacter sp.]
MRLNRLLLLLFFLPLAAYSQTTTISGKVTTSVSHEGIGKVSVFLSNSSFGTETAEDGSFTLTGVKPGQYDLVASYVGYQDYSQTILVGKEPISINIPLLPKINQLRGVVITTPANWKKNWEEFRKAFIGTSENAKNCVVVNPHVVSIVNSSRRHTLEAWSDDFLIMENKALGYRVKFLIDTFSNNGLTGIISWQGKAVFQELPGSAEQKKAWRLKRQETYYGSSRDFYKSLYTGNLTQEGFIVKKLHRELNPERPQEGVIMQKLKFFNDGRHRDSLNYWIIRENMSKYYHESLSTGALQPEQIFAKTTKPGLFIISFTDCLYVIYTKRHEETDFKDIYRPLDMENFETSVLTLSEPYAVFDMNGVVFNGAPLNEGTWSKAKLAELLPYDYSPEQDK